MFFQQNGGLVSRLAEPCKTTEISQNVASQHISRLTTVKAKILHNKTTYTDSQRDSSVSITVEWLIINICRQIFSTSGHI